MNIERYMDDGANWQAQCVLAYIRANATNAYAGTWNNETKKYDAEIQVGRLENCREQGYVFTIEYNCKQVMHYWVCEHRNCDSICVKKFYGFFLNTPTIDDVPMKDKYDYDKTFSYGDIIGCSEYIIKSMVEELSKAIIEKTEK